MLNWLQSKLFGVDLEATQTSINNSDARLAQLNWEKYQSGQWTYEQYRQAMANLAASHVNVKEEVHGAFVEGWNEGASNIREAIGGSINFSLGSIFRLIPWQVWVIAGGVLF
ncbi:MAG: hypothetical protein ACK4UN_04090, partial [Limisphaerales bacterium]